MSSQNLDIDVDGLHKVHEERDRNRRLVFETIYAKCRDKIFYTNNVLYQKKCSFKIPHMIWGLPLYNYTACVCYMVYRLRSQHFTVKYRPPNNIDITWEKKTGYCNPDESEDSISDSINKTYYYTSPYTETDKPVRSDRKSEKDYNRKSDNIVIEPEQPTHIQEAEKIILSGKKIEPYKNEPVSSTNYNSKGVVKIDTKVNLDSLRKKYLK